ncbi:MAG: hypothetical protein ACK5P5_13300 [Pseudobdellovibrionaceae bacterium]
MKKEEQSNSQLLVLDGHKPNSSRTQGLKRFKATQIFLFTFSAALIAAGLYASGLVLLLSLGLGAIIALMLSYMFFKKQSELPVIEVEARTLEQVLESRIAKLKFGEHPAHGEKTAELFDRYKKIFQQSEKILYQKLDPSEMTAQRFQKIFDEMKENLYEDFKKITQTLELSSKSSLDSASLGVKMQSMEKNLKEITTTMDSFQQTQLGTSISTFDQSFLIEEMKKLTTRLQNMD